VCSWHCAVSNDNNELLLFLPRAGLPSGQAGLAAPPTAIQPQMVSTVGGIGQRVPFAPSAAAAAAQRPLQPVRSWRDVSSAPDCDRVGNLGSCGECDGAVYLS